ncbi:hypothetical protein FEM48_Zijuj09G0149900 [Ziziphus jujuba var. spinosa]|uniref:CMP-sialic acid transporter 4 n=1 Tax=Ziziphus jujuba var. spinosa TaxID=714518 RepID=A0A978UTN5_ZIZJJ|nr:hypothetical protein FEM48_Zijuj09G0149900 [Ziziphus jujuba var. spinosa]
MLKMSVVTLISDESRHMVTIAACERGDIAGAMLRDKEDPVVCDKWSIGKSKTTSEQCSGKLGRESSRALQVETQVNRDSCVDYSYEFASNSDCVVQKSWQVESLKCALSLAALGRIWNNEGVTEDNRLSTTLDEVIVYPIPALLYLVKNLLQYYIFAYVDAPGYQILKNLNIISTGVLYRIILKKKLSEIQWAAFILLCAGCTTAQLNSNSDHVLQTPFQGWIMAIVMALLSGFAGVYTEAIIKKRPSRNINVQNFWLYVFGMAFNAVAILIQDFDAVMNKGFFHGYSFITVLMILNHALSGIAVSMVMKYADNIVKVYSTSVAMLLTAVVSLFLFGFHLSLAFFLGSIVVSVSVYLHSIADNLCSISAIKSWNRMDCVFKFLTSHSVHNDHLVIP